MKIICLILSFLSTNFSCKSSVQDNDSFKKIIIEWVGEIDKPIKSIQICFTCKNDLKQNQFNISKTTFNGIVDILKLKFESHSLIKISINENNKNIQKQRLIKLLELMKKSKENENLSDELEIFIKRIG
jgi:hypothetical protein